MRLMKKKLIVYLIDSNPKKESITKAVEKIREKNKLWNTTMKKRIKMIRNKSVSDIDSLGMVQRFKSNKNITNAVCCCYKDGMIYKNSYKSAMDILIDHINSSNYDQVILSNEDINMLRSVNDKDIDMLSDITNRVNTKVIIENTSNKLANIKLSVI